MKEVYAERGEVILLGRRGEHLARRILFDVTDWQAAYGEGTVQMLVQRSQDERPYPCAVSVRNGIARWDVRAVDVAVVNKGRVELQYCVGDTVVKSDIYRTETMEAIGEVGSVPPNPEKDWVETVLQAARDAEQSAQSAHDVIAQAITIGENGNWFINGGDTCVSAIGPQGEAGSRGPAGESGLPRVDCRADKTATLALESNVEYQFYRKMTSLTVTGFTPGESNRASYWCIRFRTADEGITVTLPDYVVWSYGATPVFTGDREYTLMFTLSIEPDEYHIIGVWSEVEA